jgi:hypothetical protein
MMKAPTQIDTSKSLAELTGVDWGLPPSGASTLVRERHEMRRKPLGQLSPDQIRRLLDMGCEPEVLVPIALKRSDVAESVALLSAVLRVRNYDWRSRPDELRLVRDQVYHADNLLGQIEGDLDVLAIRVSLWRLYAEFERDLSGA